MKTGRVRSKEAAPVAQAAPTAPKGDQAPKDTQAAVAPPPSSQPPAAPAQTRAPGNLVLWVFIGIVAVIACIVLLMLIRGGTKPDAWVPASRASGEWTTGVTVMGPQLTIQQAWQTDCTNGGGAVRAETCVSRDTGRWNDQPSDQYDEYAYNIYYDETWQKPYQAEGAEFVTTTLGGDDRIQGSRRYVTQEQLKNDSCQQTEYTVWVDDPQSAQQEIEVYLLECEVWNRVTVYDQVQDQWCQCEVTQLVSLGETNNQGTGFDILWPQPVLPSGGRSEQSFSGRVMFVGEDYTFTVTTTDPRQYQEYLSGQYYIAIKDGRPISVSRTPPGK
jgi:hypothetical protein